MSAQPQEGATRLGAVLIGGGWAAGQVREHLAALDEIELLGAAATVGEALGRLDTWDVDVVVYAIDCDSLPLGDMAAIRDRTSAPVIVAAPAAATGVLAEALLADAADVVLLPQPPEALLFAARKAAGRRLRAVPAPEPEAACSVTVFSPKGGTGKTAVAANLAVAAATAGRRTLLIDLDLQFGDCAIVLGLDASRTIHDLAASPGEIDSEKLAGYVTRHSSGLDLLAAPAQPEEAELVPVTRVVRLLEVARETYDVTVVDTSPFLHGPTLAAIDHTDELILVAMLDVPTLKDVRQSLRTLELIGFPQERLSLTLNRATAQVGITQAEVEAALGTRFRYALPDDRDVPLAVNRGNPVVVSEPSAPFARAIRELAETALEPRARAGRRGEER